MNQTIAYHQVAFNDLTLQAQRASKNASYAQAEELLLQAYEHAKQIFGPDHGEVGLLLLHLADVCRLQGKDELADEYEAETDKIALYYELTSQ